MKKDLKNIIIFFLREKKYHKFWWYDDDNWHAHYTLSRQQHARYNLTCRGFSVCFYLLLPPRRDPAFFNVQISGLFTRVTVVVQSEAKSQTVQLVGPTKHYSNQNSNNLSRPFCSCGLSFSISTYIDDWPTDRPC